MEIRHIDSVLTTVLPVFQETEKGSAKVKDQLVLSKVKSSKSCLSAFFAAIWRAIRTLFCCPKPKTANPVQGPIKPVIAHTTKSLDKPVITPVNTQVPKAVVDKTPIKSSIEFNSDQSIRLELPNLGAWESVQSLKDKYLQLAIQIKSLPKEEVNGSLILEFQTKKNAINIAAELMPDMKQISPFILQDQTTLQELKKKDRQFKAGFSFTELDQLHEDLCSFYNELEALFANPPLKKEGILHKIKDANRLLEVKKKKLVEATDAIFAIQRRQILK